MSDERLNSLLKRAALFHDAVRAHVYSLEPAESTRPVVSFQAGLLSLEHGTASLVLIGQGFLSSAYALMRPQFECLVRGIWLLHVATPTWVEKLAEPLSVEAAKRANEGPMLADMLRELDAAPDAPKALIAQLKELRDVAWKAMNSYAHGGIHPLSRVVTGYPPQLTYDVVRNSNAVTALSAQLASILSGDPLDMADVDADRMRLRRDGTAFEQHRSGSPVDGAAEQALGAIDEVLRVLRRLKADEIARQHATHDASRPRQQSEDVVGGKRDVKKEGDAAARRQPAQIARHAQ